MVGNGRSRRRFLAGLAGLAAAGGAAGCLGGPSASLEPHVPPERLREGGWKRVSDFDERASREVSVAGTTRTVRVHAKADVYENAEPVRRIADGFGIDPETLDVPAVSFLAAKARTDPPAVQLLALSEAAVERAMDAAEERARRELRDLGFRNVRRVAETDLAISAAGTATHRRYEADYPYEARRFTRSGTPITVESGVFTVEAQLAVWPYRGLIATASGLYPGEAGRLTLAARGATRTESLGFRPDRYRGEVRDLIARVS